jgi:hypothetical protein
MKSFIALIAIGFWPCCAASAGEPSTAHRSVLEYMAANPAETGLSDPLVQLRKIGERSASPVLIWWDVLALSSGSTNYVQVKQKYIDAATAIHGVDSAEVAAVVAAFSAVGIN